MTEETQLSDFLTAHYSGIPCFPAAMFAVPIETSRPINIQVGEEGQRDVNGEVFIAFRPDLFPVWTDLYKWSTDDRYKPHFKKV